MERGKRVGGGEGMWILVHLGHLKFGRHDFLVRIQQQREGSAVQPLINKQEVQRTCSHNSLLVHCCCGQVFLHPPQVILLRQDIR